jgi:hypothetical protein
VSFAGSLVCVCLGLTQLIQCREYRFAVKKKFTDHGSTMVRLFLTSLVFDFDFKFVLYGASY